MSFIEMLQAAISLDIVFFIDLVMNNLFWVFGFIAAGYFFSNQKSFIEFGLVYGLIIVLTTDIFHLVGFGIYTGVGLLLLYLGRMATLLFLENTKRGQDLIPITYILVFFSVFTIAALGWI